MSIANLILCAIGIFLGGLLVILFGAHFLANWIKPLRYFECNIIGWHCWKSQRQYTYNDGCSNHCICPWCGKDCMEDSQGNIF